MEIKRQHIIGIIAAVLIVLVDLIFLRAEKIFYFVLGIASVVGVFPFIFSLITESQREVENNEMFLEFSRDLVENVKAGTPISKSIINVRTKYYGSLTPHIQKLGNQIALGIPVKEAFRIFAKDVNSTMVRRAVTLISEAEKAGGNIEDVLDSVARSVSEIEKLKKERQATISGLVVQGYIIFLVFIAIMLIMQFKLLPLVAELPAQAEGGGGGSDLGGGFSMGGGFDVSSFTMPLLYMLVVQGAFTGLVIGKLAEGKVKAGIKHSFILAVISILSYTGTKAFF